MTTLRLYLITTQKQKDSNESATYDPLSSSEDFLIPLHLTKWKKEVKPIIPEVIYTWAGYIPR